MLIAFDLDVELRCRNRNDSLASALRDFYLLYADANTGYTTSDVLRFFEKRHRGLGRMLEQEIAYPAGLTVERHLNELSFGIQYAPVYSLGLRFERTDEARIYEVEDTSAAASAGIAPGDVLVSIDDFAYSRKALGWFAARPHPIKLQIQRGQRLLSFEVTPRVHSEITALIWRGTAGQIQLLRSWLCRNDFDPGSQQVFSPEFHENFHGVQERV